MTNVSPHHVAASEYGLATFKLLAMVTLAAILGIVQPAIADEKPDENLEQTEEQEERPSASDSQSSEENEAVAPETAEETLGKISYDLSALPFPTRRMRELILEATKSGDIEKLRALIGTGDSMTRLSLGGIDGDPIEFMKEQSGDPEGYEILAILEEVLEAGYVHLDAGTERELYVWPYFYAFPIDSLTPRQRVELYRIITHGDYQDMEDFGGYIFYRIGISPTGRWRFFVAGD